jgi:methylthioribose-1-phosphate isomerase
MLDSVMTHTSAPAQWQPVQPIIFTNNKLELLDQRILPQKKQYLIFSDPIEVAQAITDMVVRGAPAIGITAAFGIVLAGLNQFDQLPSKDRNKPYKFNLEEAFCALESSRPTAMNLFWALNKMREILNINEQLTAKEQINALILAANKILSNDITANQKMGELGASLIEKNSQVYTHCNAGALATGGYGTALGVIRSAFSQDKITQVYAGETRPWLQGSRLTAWELMQDNIPVKISSEGAAGQLLKQGKVKWIIVGADRIAANGDVANKVGTYNLAVLAKYHGVKVMVVAPSTTFDLSINHGDNIPIEQRPPYEVTHFQGMQIAPEGCQAINPSFDTTPNELIDVIICEKGIIKPPFELNIKNMEL